MSFLRHGKHSSGIDADFSSAITSDHLLMDDLTRYGIRGNVSALAYDPIQSLLAVGTSDYGEQHGQIHVFGQGRIQVTFTLGRKSTVRHLRLVDSKLIAVDSANEMSIYDMELKQRAATYTPPGTVSVLLADPSVDWIFLGLQTGEVVAYDADRYLSAPFRIPNLWKEINPKSRMLPVVSLALHPRDLGSLLIGYAEGAVVFSLKQHKPTLTLRFELPPGAPGADSDPSMIQTLRRPRLTTALWHPTGTFILTGYEDSCMAFWDPKDGKLLQARTLQDADVHLTAGSQPMQPWADTGTFSVRQPFFKIAWCCSANADETNLLVAGGNSVSLAAKGLTLFELGLTPSVLTSSYQILSEHFASPKRQRVLPTPLEDDVIDFCLINRTSPHYANSHDPMVILGILSSGELIALSYPDGAPISPSAVFHPSLTMVSPSPTKLSTSSISRERWLGMTGSKPADAPQFLKGGAELKRVNKRPPHRELVHTVHKDGTMKIWDLGHNDEIENQECIEIDLSKGLARLTNLDVSAWSLAYDTGELAIGTSMGELIIYKWGRNKFFRSSGFERGDDAKPGEIRDVSNRADSKVKEGMLPLSLVVNNSPVTAVAVSDIGFIAAGYEDGHICVIDMRGPAVIFNSAVQSTPKESKRSSILKGNSHSNQPPKPEIPTCLEFSIITLGDNSYSSICLHVGTNLGHVATLTVTPDGPRYTVQYNASFNVEEPPICLIPINAESGFRATANGPAFAGLPQGHQVHGVLLVVTKSGARIIKPPTGKGNSKSFDETCLSANVAEYHDRGIALLCAMDSGKVRAYSIPALKEIGYVNLGNTFDPQRLSESKVTRNGCIVSWTGPTEIGLVSAWGTGRLLSERPADDLFNPQMPIPTRPTISNFQWISGTQHVSAEDFDLLIGGPDRPMSKRMMEEQRLAAAQERQDARQKAQSPDDGSSSNSVFGNMTKGLQQRTEGLSLWSDNMDKLEEHSASFADAASKFASQQKKKMLIGGLKNFF